MKTYFLCPFLILLMAMLMSAQNAFAIKACIVDNFGETFSISVHGYNSPGDVKNLDGTADFSIYGAGIWAVTGTVNKSTKTISMHCVNPNPDGCISYASNADITMNYTGGFYTMEGSFSNDCGNSGAISATGTTGGFCEGMAGQLAFTQGTHSGVGASRSSSSFAIARVQTLPAMSRDFEESMFGDEVEIHSFPVPMSEEDTIIYTLPENDQVRVAIYNHIGQLVKVLVNEPEPAGKYTLRWDASDKYGNRVKDGMYFLSIETNAGTQTQAISVAK